MKPDTALYSLLSHHPTSFTPVSPPCDPKGRDFLQAARSGVDFRFAFMRTLFQVLAIAAILLLDAASADAADCICDQLSAEGCIQSAEARGEPIAPPLWCERTDDPRCMPASTQGTSTTTLVPVAMSWAQPTRWGAPPRTGTRMAVRVEGAARAQHSRRVERPPR